MADAALYTLPSRSDTYSLKQGHDSDQNPLLHMQQISLSTESKDSINPPIEPPKKVLRHDTRLVFYRFLLLHLLPVGAAIGLIILNIETQFYGLQNPNNYLFQWTAKVHEVLMQLSIGTAVIDYIQYLLTDAPSVPFGAIFAAFQSSQIGHLCSREFYAAVTSAGFTGHVRLIFAIFVPFSIILATAAGPSSAMALQPRNVNFTLPDQLYAVNISSEALYHDSILDAAMPLNSTIDYSPAKGWEYLAKLPALGSDYMNTQRGLIELKNNKTQMPEVYTVETDYAVGEAVFTDVARTFYIQYAPNSTFVTLQQYPVAQALSIAGNIETREGMIVTRKEMEMPQPYVSTLCTPNFISGEDDTWPIQFPDRYISGCETCNSSGEQDTLLNYPNVVNYTAISRQDIWERAKHGGQFIWVDDINVTTPVPGKGLGVIVVQPSNCTTLQGAHFLSTSACVVGSTWATTKSILESYIGHRSATQTNSIESEIGSDSFISIPDWSKPPIEISKKWAETLNSMTTYQNQSVVDNLLHTLPATDNVCPGAGYYPLTDTLPHVPQERPFMHEGLVSGYIANALTRSADLYELWVKEDKLWIESQALAEKNFSTLTTPPGEMITIHGKVVGWAWNLDGKGIKAALTVLLAYVLYASIYVIFTFVSGRNAGTWSNMSSMTALAMRSAPPEALRNTCSGIGETDTLRKMVGIREVEDRRHLELVFMDDEREGRVLRRVTTGREYG